MGVVSRSGVHVLVQGAAIGPAAGVENLADLDGASRFALVPLALARRHRGDGRAIERCPCLVHKGKGREGQSGNFHDSVWLSSFYYSNNKRDFKIIATIVVVDPCSGGGEVAGYLYVSLHIGNTQRAERVNMGEGFVPEPRVALAVPHIVESSPPITEVVLDDSAWPAAFSEV